MAGNQEQDHVHRALVVMPFAPISGLIGDIFGHKYLLSIEIIFFAISFTSFHFIPRYNEGPLKLPFVNVTEDSNIYALHWPICRYGIITIFLFQTILI